MMEKDLPHYLKDANNLNQLKLKRYLMVRIFLHILVNIFGSFLRLNENHKCR